MRRIIFVFLFVAGVVTAGFPPVAASEIEAVSVAEVTGSAAADSDGPFMDDAASSETAVMPVAPAGLEAELFDDTARRKTDSEMFRFLTVVIAALWASKKITERGSR